MNIQDLLDDIREICAVNVDMDWSDKDPNEEFTAILNLIEEYNKEGK